MKIQPLKPENMSMGCTVPIAIDANNMTKDNTKCKHEWQASTVNLGYFNCVHCGTGKIPDNTNKEDWDLSYKDPEQKKILSSYHSYLKNNFGKAKHCESATCEKKSEQYEWCLKTGRKYSKNPEDYLWLCRKCHRKYDLTPEKKEKAIKNLMWYGKQKQWSVYSKQCVDCKTTERKYKANGRCTKCYNKYALKKQKGELLYKTIKGKESINY